MARREIDKALVAKAADMVKQIDAGATSRPRQERRAGGENRERHPPRRQDGLAPSWSSAPSSRARRRRRLGGDARRAAVFKVTADATPPPLRRSRRQGDRRAAGAATEQPWSSNMSTRWARAWRDDRSGACCRRPRAADAHDDRMIPTLTTRLLPAPTQAGAASVAVTTLVADLETPVSAYLKLAAAAPATCSCSSRSRAARSAAATR